MLFVTVVLKLASSPKAAANSSRVFKVAGAESTRFATAVLTAAVFGQSLRTWTRDHCIFDSDAATIMATQKNLAVRLCKSIRVHVRVRVCFMNALVTRETLAE